MKNVPPVSIISVEQKFSEKWICTLLLQSTCSENVLILAWVLRYLGQMQGTVLVTWNTASSCTLMFSLEEPEQALIINSSITTRQATCASQLRESLRLPLKASMLGKKSSFSKLYLLMTYALICPCSLELTLRPGHPSWKKNGSKLASTCCWKPRQNDFSCWHPGHSFRLFALR